MHRRIWPIALCLLLLGLSMTWVRESSADAHKYTGSCDQLNASVNLGRQATVSGPYCPILARDDVARVELDSVVGLDTNGHILADCPLSFRFRLVNNAGVGVAAVANAFRVYSPDAGAHWTALTWDSTSPLYYYNCDSECAVQSAMFDLAFAINTGSVSGSGADTVLFAGIAMDSAGMPNGFDSVAYVVHTQVDSTM